MVVPAAPAVRPQAPPASPRVRPGYVTAEEYLRREEIAFERSEWIDGEVRPMPGASIQHEALAPELRFCLREAFAGRPARVLGSDMMIRIPDGPFYYADGCVAAVPPETEPPVRPGGPRNVLRNPLVILEILSRSTGRRDRGEKLDAYRTIPSLTDYLIASQTEPRVEHHRRTAGGWEREEYAGPDLAVPLAAGVTATLGPAWAVLDGLG